MVVVKLLVDVKVVVDLELTGKDGLGFEYVTTGGGGT